MPPSWQLSPARSRKDHSLQSQRWCCRRAILYRHDEGAAVIPDSGPEIKNHCTLEDVFRQIHAVIPKSGPEITNQCSRGIAAVCRRNHSSSMQRRLESDAKRSCCYSRCKRNHSSLRRRKLETDTENRCLNGRACSSNFIRHSELCEGARLEFTMSDQANY